MRNAAAYFESAIIVAEFKEGGEGGSKEYAKESALLNIRQ